MENMWALLPEGLTDLFGTKLSYLEDAIRFGAVCKSWQFATKRSQFAPWLMLATYDEDQGGIQKFFSLYSGNLHDIKSPKFQGRKCWGTPHGWLVTLGLDLNIHLLNPLTGIEYSLPPQSTFKNQFDIELPNQHLRYGFVNKFVLSAAPDALHPRESCVVFAINSPTSDLAFARPGDNTWIHVETPHRGFHDVIFFKDQIYAIDRVGALVVCDINNKTTVDFAPPPKGVATTNMFYLVEMHGALHFVERIIVDDLITDFFEAHKFDFSTKSWTEIPGFDDYALFLGSGNSFAISISDFPEFRPNSIYFTDVHPMHHPYDMENDMGVYDFEEQTIDALYCGDNVCSEFSRPIFIMPSLL